jgi:FlaA1/EpsC-like NDP-sugar epimerase
VIPLSRHRIWNLVADAVLIAVAWRLTFWLRFDNTTPSFYRHLLSWQTFAIVIGIKLTIFVLFGFYNRWWRYVSTRDMWGAARGVIVGSLLVDLTLYAFPPDNTARLPRGIALIDMLLLLAFVAGSRLLARTLIERPAPGGLVARGREVLIVGAGDAAQLILRELQRSPQLGYTPIGLLDDDPRKKNLRVHGVRVLGTTSELRHILRDTEPDELIIAIPSASGETRQKIVDISHAEGIPVKTLPGLHELIAGDLNLAGQIRPVQVEDVLGREPVEVDLGEVAQYVAGQTVLVTGAGGSIGAELCRQIARVGAGRIVLVDNSEPALFEIERELVDLRGFPAALPVLADVGNPMKIRQVFEKYRPAVVFHAAAYKHVPLLEANPLEAARNNVLATKALAEIAVEFETSRFVLVSTDKAANPKNLLGQSKALCEWIIQAYGQREDIATRFVAVRFGNVLASSGSVIPIFRRQIERGGPVTVTHPEMTRYFMTIPEAVSLIVQAGAMGGRGRIFVLDMGEPVSILDLANNMIRLSGKQPGKDVEVRFIGTRAGEKIHEELWNDGETTEPTTHPKILSAQA